MSKSAPNPKSRILINDPRDVIFAKVKAALTDSLPGLEYSPEERPGVSNLMDIMCHMSDETLNIEELVLDLKGVSMRAFKERVAEQVDNHLAPIRERWDSVMKDENSRLLKQVEEAGARQAAETAARTMQEVRDAMGIAVA